MPLLDSVREKEKKKNSTVASPQKVSTQKPVQTQTVSKAPNATRMTGSYKTRNGIGTQKVNTGFKPVRRFAEGSVQKRNYETIPQSQWNAAQYAAHGRVSGDNSVFDMLSQRTSTRGDALWMPTLGGQAVVPDEWKQLSAQLGYDGPFDQKFADDLNAMYGSDVRFSKQLGVSTPTKKSSPEEWYGWLATQVADNLAENNKLNEQNDEYRKAYSEQFDQFKKINGRVPTPEEALALVDKTKYSKLTSLDDAYKYGTKIPILPVGTYYYPDCEMGWYQAKVNGVDITADNDYFDYHVQYYTNPVQETPSVQKYEWSGTDLNSISPEDQTKYKNYLLASGKREEAAAYDFACWAAQPHADGISAEPSILDSAIGYLHDEEWVNKGKELLGDEYTARRGPNGEFIGNKGSKADYMDKACYELYQVEQLMDATVAVKNEYEAYVQAMQDVFNANYERYGVEDFDKFLRDVEYNVDIDDYPNLKKYQKDGFDPDKYSYNLYIDENTFGTIEKRIWDNKEVDTNKVYTAQVDPEFEASFGDDTPSEPPLFYAQTQLKRAAQRIADRNNAEDAVTQAVVSMAESGAPVSKGAVPVSNNIFDRMLDFGDATLGYLGKLWSDVFGDKHEEKLGVNYTPAEAAAADPVLAQLDVKNMPEALTTEDIAKIVNAKVMSRVHDDDICLADGIINYALPGAKHLHNILMDRTGGVANFNALTYRNVYNDRVDAGLDDEYAARVAAYAATEVNGAVESLGIRFEGDNDLTNAAKRLLDDMAAEEGALDSYDLFMAISDDVRDRVEAIGGAGEEADSIMQKLLPGLLVGSSDAATPGFRAETNQLTNDIANGMITADDIVMAMNPPQEVWEVDFSKRQYDGFTTTEAAYAELRENGGDRSNLVNIRGVLYTRGEYSNLLGEAKTVRGGFLGSDRSYNEMSDDLKEAIGFDAIADVSKALYSSSPEEERYYFDMAVRDAIDTFIDPSKGWNTSPLMHGTTNLIGDLEELTSKKTEEEIARNLESNGMTGVEHWIEQNVIKADRTGFARNTIDFFNVLGRLTVGGFMPEDAGILKQSAYGDMIDELRAYGKYLSPGEADALWNAFANGTASIDEIKGLIRERTNSISSEEVNAINNPQAMEESYTGLDAGLEAARNYKPPTKIEDPELAGIYAPTNLGTDDQETAALVDKMINPGAKEAEVKQAFSPEELGVMEDFLGAYKRVGTAGFTLAMCDAQNLKTFLGIDLNGTRFKNGADILNSIDPNWSKPYGMNPGYNFGMLEAVGRGMGEGYESVYKVGSLANSFLHYVGNALVGQGYDPMSDNTFGYRDFARTDEYNAAMQQNVGTKGQVFVEQGTAEVVRNAVTSSFGAMFGEAVAFELGARMTGIPQTIASLANVGEALTVATTFASRMPFASNVFFSEFDKQMKDGKSVWHAALRAGIDAGIEVFTESAPFEKFSSLSVGGFTIGEHAMNAASKMGGSKAAWLMRFAQNIFSEVKEEEASEFLGRLVDYGFGVIEGKSSEDSWAEAWEGYGQAAKDTAVATAFTTVLFGAMDLGGSFADYVDQRFFNGKSLDYDELKIRMTADFIASKLAGIPEVEDIAQAERDAALGTSTYQKVKRQNEQRFAQQTQETTSEYNPATEVPTFGKKVQETEAKLAEAVKESVQQEVQQQKTEEKAEETTEEKPAEEQVEQVTEQPTEEQSTEEQPDISSKISEAAVNMMNAIAEERAKEAQKAQEAASEQTEENPQGEPQEAEQAAPELPEGAQKVKDYIDHSEDAIDNAIIEKGAQAEADKAVEEDPGIQAQEVAIEKLQSDIDGIQQKIGELQNRGQLILGQLQQAFQAAMDEPPHQTNSAPSMNTQFQKTQEKAAVDGEIADNEEKVNDLTRKIDEAQRLLEEAKQKKAAEVKEATAGDLTKKVEEYRKKKTEMDTEAARAVVGQKVANAGDVIHGAAIDEEINANYAKRAAERNNMSGTLQARAKRGKMPSTATTEAYIDPNRYTTTPTKVAMGLTDEALNQLKAIENDSNRTATQKDDARKELLTNPDSYTYGKGGDQSLTRRTAPIVEARRDDEWKDNAATYKYENESEETRQRELLGDFIESSGKTASDGNYRKTTGVNEWVPIPSKLHYRLQKAMQSKYGAVDSTMLRSFKQSGESRFVSFDPQALERREDAASEFDAVDSYDNMETFNSIADVMQDDGSMEGMVARALYGSAATSDEEIRGRHVMDGLIHVTENNDWLVMKSPERKATSADDKETYKGLTTRSKYDKKTGMERGQEAIDYAQKWFDHYLDIAVQKTENAAKCRNAFTKAVSNDGADSKIALAADKAYQKALKESSKANIEVDIWRKKLDDALDRQKRNQEFIKNYEETSGQTTVFFIDKSGFTGFNAADLSEQALRILKESDVQLTDENSGEFYGNVMKELLGKIFEGAVTSVTVDNKDVDQTVTSFVEAHGGVDEEGLGGEKFAPFISKDYYNGDMVYQANEKVLHEFLTEKEKKGLKIGRTAAQYNAAVNDDLSDYIEKRIRVGKPLSDEDIRFLRNNFIVATEEEGRKGFYVVDQDDTHELGIRVADRKNPEANMYLRDENGNYSPYIAKQRLIDTMALMQELAKKADAGELNSHGRKAYYNGKKDYSIYVKYVDGFGATQKRYVGEFYTDEDGTSRWWPSYRDLMKYADEITCNFKCARDENKDGIDRLVNFKLYPSGSHDTQQVDMSETDDNEWLRSSGEIKAELDKMADFFRMFDGIDEETKTRFYHKWWDESFAYAKNKLKAAVDAVDRATDDGLQKAIADVEMAQAEYDFWANGYNKEKDAKGNETGRAVRDSTVGTKANTYDTPYKDKSGKPIQSTKNPIQQLEQAESMYKLYTSDSRFMPLSLYQRQAAALAEIIPQLRENAEQYRQQQESEQKPARPDPIATAVAEAITSTQETEQPAEQPAEQEVTEQMALDAYYEYMDIAEDIHDNYMAAMAARDYEGMDDVTKNYRTDELEAAKKKWQDLEAKLKAQAAAEQEATAVSPEAKLAILKGLSDDGADVKDVRSKAIADYHQDKMQDMSDEEKTDYLYGLARQQETNPDGYTIDPTVNYDKKLGEELQRQDDKAKSADAKWLKSVSNKYYKTERGVRNALARADRLEQEGHDVTAAREHLNSNLKAIQNPSDAGKQMLIDAADTPEQKINLQFFAPTTQEEAVESIMDTMPAGLTEEDRMAGLAADLMARDMSEQAESRKVDTRYNQMVENVQNANNRITTAAEAKAAIDELAEQVAKIANLNDMIDEKAKKINGLEKSLANYKAQLESILRETNTRFADSRDSSKFDSLAKKFSLIVKQTEELKDSIVGIEPTQEQKDLLEGLANDLDRTRASMIALEQTAGVVWTDDERRNYGKALGLIPWLTDKKTDEEAQKASLVDERNMSKDMRDNLADVILQSAEAQRIIHNEVTFNMTEYVKKDSEDPEEVETVGQIRARRINNAVKLSRKLVDNIKKSKFYIHGKQTTITSENLVNMLLDGIVDEERLQFDRSVASAVNQALKFRKKALALIELGIAYGDLKGHKISTEEYDKVYKKVKGDIVNLTKLYGYGTEADRIREEDAKRNAVYDMVEYVNYLERNVFTGSLDTGMSTLAFQQRILSNNIEQAEQLVFDRFGMSSTDEILTALTGIRGGRQPQVIMDVLVGSVYDSMFKKSGKNKIVPFDMRLLTRNLSSFRQYVVNTLGENAPVFNSLVVDPVLKGEAKATEWVNKMTQMLDDTGLKTISQYEAMGHILNSGMTDEEIAEQYSEDADILIKAKPVYQKVAQMAIEDQNFVLARNGKELIKWRKHYFPHQMEETNPFFKLLGIDNEYNKLPTGLLGKTEGTTPGHQFASHTLKRSNENTDNINWNAREVFGKYLHNAAEIIFQTDNLTRLNDLITQLGGNRKQTGDHDVDYEAISPLEYSTAGKLAQRTRGSLFVSALEAFRDQVAGKKTGVLDRAAERQGKRAALSVIQAATKMQAVAKVGGNLKSCAMNVVPVVTSASMDPFRAVHAYYSLIYNSLNGVDLLHHPDLQRSNFFKARCGKNREATNRFDKATGWLFVPMEVTDRVSTAATWLTCYYSCLDKLGGVGNESQAAQMADVMAVNIMSDKGRGNKGEAYNGTVSGLALQFTQEAVNQVGFLFDKNRLAQFRGGGTKGIAKALASLLAVFVAGFYGNKIVGSDSTIDPIGIGKGIVDDIKSGKKASQAIGRGFTRFVDQLNPIDNITSGNILEAPSISGFTDIFSALFGGGGEAALSALFDEKDENDESNKNDSQWIGDLARALWGWVPGSTQGKRFYDTAMAWSKGYATNNQGKIKYGYEPTVGGVIQSALFGPNATRAGQEYVRGGYHNFSKTRQEGILGLADMLGIPFAEATDMYDREQAASSKQSEGDTMERRDKNNAAVMDEARELRSGVTPSDLWLPNNDAINNDAVQKGIRMYQESGKVTYPTTITAYKDKNDPEYAMYIKVKGKDVPVDQETLDAMNEEFYSNALYQITKIDDPVELAKKLNSLKEEVKEKVWEARYNGKK